ncbi:MAG: TIGR03936 family radical SAM-associated protein [Spirochaetaceae bacterium]|nr:TIGR03936 family radical SAM-associated protein [Spirochaetaceae bacterium]
MKNSGREYIDILDAVGKDLFCCESPARYAGGESGCLARREASLQTVFVFPDLYEIGMSNNAFKIIYNRLNNIYDVSCDRAFAPAPDFEKLLAEKNVPLYGLDTGLALRSSDLLMITISYELCAVTILSILKASKLELHSADRGENDPVVIAGGPCCSNPLPYARFFDIFWIGEAEDSFFNNLIPQIRAMKQAGGLKKDIIARLAEHPSVWIPGKTGVERAVDTGFETHAPRPAIFPIPSARIIQQHASLEIMRGCPNGCRFCHAGIWYRPHRQKTIEVIEEEAAAYITEGGFREISLSSLSSGDYTDIEKLLDRLNNRFAKYKVSFQLPSLHVSTLSFDLLDKVSLVRKSGLTFAVETPDDRHQLSLNKQVTLDMVTDILAAARQNGYKSAKFYFMIGLPVFDGEEYAEEDAIISFITDAAKRSRMKFNVSIGVFVPKPHTPFQWAVQMDEETARRKLYKIRDSLQGHHIKLHDPFISALEGLISRGDERSGGLIEEAFHAGCRLDCWSEHFKKDVWRGITGAHAELCAEILRERDTGEALPWEVVRSGVSKEFLLKEWERARRQELTQTCAQSCSACGICPLREAAPTPREAALPSASSPAPGPRPPAPRSLSVPARPCDSYRILFAYTKRGKAALLSHLATAEVFARAALRADIPVAWTQGFNPSVKLDFASPLAVGINAEQEIALIDTERPFEEAAFIRLINARLPEGIAVKQAYSFIVPAGSKKYSLPALWWGSVYRRKDGRGNDIVEAAQESVYKEIWYSGGYYGLVRAAVLAKMPPAGKEENKAGRGASASGKPASYFYVYRRLYAPSASAREGT